MITCLSVSLTLSGVLRWHKQASPAGSWKVKEGTSPNGLKQNQERASRPSTFIIRITLRLVDTGASDTLEKIIKPGRSIRVAEMQIQCCVLL